MKKFISLIIMVLMIVNICVFAVDSPIKVIKIGLVYGEKATDEVVLGSLGGFKICESVDGNDTVLTQISDVNEIIARLGNDGIGLYTKDGESAIYIYKGTDILTIYPNVGNIWAVGMEYRGGIQLIPKDGRINVINIIDMEQYLYGVVTKEMYASWPMEALKAQAVCSRTYLLTTGMIRHKSQGFDLCASVHCQAYGGVAKETENGIEAVEQTRGQVVQYQGKIAEVFYYASSGGFTEDVKNVWGSTNYPYLQAIEDKYENAEDAKSSWRVEFTSEELGKKLALSGYNIGSVKDMVILEKTPSNRVLKLMVTGENGNCTLQKEKSRTAFGFKSQMYDVDSIGGTPTAYILSAYGKYSLGIDSIMTQGGMVELKQGLYIKSQSGLGGELLASDKKFIFTGRGYGHGIGMSQWGAKGMADKGFKYDEIIKYYFQGVEIVKE